MSLLAILVPSALVLALAYRLYGAILARLFRLDDTVATPGQDLERPAECRTVSNLHFQVIGRHATPVEVHGMGVRGVPAELAIGRADLEPRGADGDDEGRDLTLAAGQPMSWRMNSLIAITPLVRG